MMEQNVDTMLDHVFELIGKKETPAEVIKIPCELRVY